MQLLLYAFTLNHFQISAHTHTWFGVTSEQYYFNVSIVGRAESKNFKMFATASRTAHKCKCYTLKLQQCMEHIMETEQAALWVIGKKKSSDRLKSGTIAFDFDVLVVTDFTGLFQYIYFFFTISYVERALTLYHRQDKWMEHCADKRGRERANWVWGRYLK